MKKSKSKKKLKPVDKKKKPWFSKTSEACKKQNGLHEKRRKSITRSYNGKTMS